MSLETFNPIFVNTVLARLALLFLPVAHGDITAACDAARELVASYDPSTPDELTIVADIIGNSFHSQELLSQAADRALSPAQVKSLLSSAVSLHKEAEKARRSLALARKQEQPRAAAPAEGPEPAQPPVAEPPSAPPSQPPQKRPTRAWPAGDAAAGNDPAIGYAAVASKQPERYQAAASG